MQWRVCHAEVYSVNVGDCGGRNAWNEWYMIYAVSLYGKPRNTEVIEMQRIFKLTSKSMALQESTIIMFPTCRWWFRKNGMIIAHGCLYAHGCARGGSKLHFCGLYM